MRDRVNALATSSFELSSEKLRMLMQGYETSFPAQLAEQFPRIVNDLVILWHTPHAMTAYLQKLLVTDRPSRQGFPRAVASEIFALICVYEEVQPSR